MMRELHGGGMRKWISASTALALFFVAAIALPLVQPSVMAQIDEEPACTNNFSATMTSGELPQRIVSLSPATTEILFALGAGDRVVGVTKYCNYPEEANEREKIGGITTVDIEKVVSLEPDLVLGDELNSEETFERLAELNLTAVQLDSTTIDEIMEKIKLVGTLTGEEESASLLVANMESRLDAIKAKTSDVVKRPKVAHVTWHDPIYVMGSGVVQSEVLEIAGGDNVFSHLDAWDIVSLEEFVEENPEVIIVSVGHGDAGMKSYEYILSEERLKGVDAVKNGRVYSIDADIISRAGPRIADATETIFEDLEDFFADEPEEIPESPGSGGSSPKNIPPPSPTPAAATVTKLSRIIPAMKAGEEVAMIFEESDVSLLALKADTNVSDVKVAVDRVEEYSYIPDPPGIAYAYLSITVDCEDAAHMAGKVEFKVAKSWLADNHIDEAAVTLSRYHENEGWVALPTSKVGEDNATVYFEAETPEFSVFVITGVVTVAETAVPVPVVAPTATIPATTPTPTRIATSTPAPASEMPGFRAIFTFAGLLAVAYLLSLRMKRSA
jgi:PGF-pre-PGF domain-containing protein